MIPAYIGVQESFARAAKDGASAQNIPSSLPETEKDARDLFRGSLNRCRKAASLGAAQCLIFTLQTQVPADCPPLDSSLSETHRAFKKILGEAGFTVTWRRFALSTTKDGKQTCCWSLWMNMPKAE